jgi:CubicO group peptidase (beta-lactamase class C family)
MQAFMEPRRIPGAALAVTRHGHLLYARGYGLADRANCRMVWPVSMFRLASLSKPITAVAILQLAQRGWLDLEVPVIGLLELQRENGLHPVPVDKRLLRVTARHLLQHTGGWMHAGSADPIFQADRIVTELGLRPPLERQSVMEFMLRQPLDFDPGTRYAYSNVGYLFLGRVVEKVTGLPYEEYVQRHVLAPAGIRQMQLGRTVPEQRHPDEVQYYTGVVPLPGSAFCLELMDAHGGWVGSAVEMARFLAALEFWRRPLLDPVFHAEMIAPPPPPAGRTGKGRLLDSYYGCGWMIRPIGTGGEINYWHAGSLPGTYALAVRRWDGVSWVVLFNQRSEDPALPDEEIDPALHRAAESVVHWPSHDLFPHYLQASGSGTGDSSSQLNLPKR